MILTNSGVLKLMQRIKSFITAQLNTKANSVHTHTISEIDDLSSLQMGGYTKSEVDTLLTGKADTSHTHTKSEITDFPALSTVATSGDYDDLSNKPTIPIVDSALSSTSTNALQNKAINTELSKKANTSHTHTVSDVTDFPTLATVATSGSYNDLSNKPATMTPTSHTHGNITNDGKIGSNANKPLITTTGGTVTTGSFGTSANTFCEGNDSRLSDARTPTAHTHTVSDVTDFPSLATVATSGSYDDLSNKPTIPTVNNATLTIQKNGTTVKTFTANASSNVTANITVPTKVSELDNDSNYLTSVPNLDASKITSGTIDIARLPAGALERLVTVTNKTARFALTTSTVQLGDVVKQTDTGVMYYVVDTANLNSEDGYSEFTAGSATSVPWSGVTGKPSSYTPSSHTHGNITNAGAIGSTANKPLITTTNGVITTGSFGTTANTFCQGNDSRLSDARTPTAHTHNASDITSGLATVATSGSYNDLSNKPTIPTVNNATLTIQQNGTTVDTFTANSSTDKTVNIQCVDLNNNQTVGGDKEFTGTTTAHDLVPSATDTYNFGSSSYQWNNAYIKSLTINGVACGDILTHNASEFVGVTGEQTIAGIKKFRDTIVRNVGNFTAGEAPTAQTTCLVLKHTNNDATHSANTILSYMFTSGESMCELTQNPCIGSVARTWFRTNTDGSYSIYSYTKNGALGTPSYKWKDVQTEKINGINPGALSLPSNSYVNVDTTNWDLTCQNELMGSFTPTADGWLMLHVANSGTSEVNFWVIGGVLRINNKSTLNTSDNNNFNMITIPVEKDTTYDIRGNASEYVAGRRIAYCRFTPCQGNV